MSEILNSENKKGKRVFVIAVKTIIAVASLYFIFREINVRNDIDDVRTTLTLIASKPITYFNIALVFFLMFFNWGLEARKWQLLLRRVRSISFFSSLIATFSGITVSFFTPNRMGEFIGRVLHLEKQERISAALSSVLGSLSQTIITILIGSICAIDILTNYVPLADQFPYLFWTGILLTLSLFVLIYFWSEVVVKLLRNVSVIKKYSEQLTVLEKYTIREKMTILCYSLLRYVVFSLQFFILLLTMEVWIQPLLAFKLIATLFLVLSIIPGTALTELALRSSVALALFSTFSDNHTGIIAAAFMIWFINLVIPAILGTFSIYFIRMQNGKRSTS